VKNEKRKAKNEDTVPITSLPSAKGEW